MPPAEAGTAVRVLDWAETERLTRHLASRLRDELGGDLPAFTFQAIPRGGLFVLGALSYLLDLDKARLRLADGPPPERVVLVDDCALSGARLGREVERTPAGRIVAAHLLSHPELRRAVEETEPRVEACIAGGDLTGRDDLPPEGLAGFAVRWQERLPGRRYWLGPVEPVAFPWSEPETVWWNAREGRLEDGWHRVSPWRCLRFRVELALPEAEGGRGPLDLAPGVSWKLDGERLLLRGGPEDRLHGLRGTALDAWRGLVAFGDRERAWRFLDRRYEADPEELRRDVDEMVEDLLARGLLVDAT